MQRCSAKSKRSGDRCKNFAIKGVRVCRMHGAGGGPKTHASWIRCKRAPMKHGCYSKEAMEELKECRELMKKEMKCEKMAYSKPNKEQ